MSIIQLGEITGLGRQVAGRIVRGEVVRLAPDQANKLVAVLPLTMEQLLEANAYNVVVSPQHRVPPELARLWPKLPPATREGILLIAQTAATLAEAAEGQGR